MAECLLTDLEEDDMMEYHHLIQLRNTPLVATTISYRTREDPNSKVFMEYIGSKFTGVRFSDVPINPNIDFHFILSSAIDYTISPSPTPTDGDFNVFWDTHNLTPSQVTSIKQRRHNVKFALSLGGHTIGHRAPAYFNPTSIDSWVSNAVSSLTAIIDHYNLDGIDVDYEHFNADPATFTECIGRLLTTLKLNGVISFASIAPYDNDEVQRHYQALWSEYGHVIDYVNFQFYAYYNAGATESQFLSNYARQSENYQGGKILPGMVSDGSGGLTPENGFYSACYTLKEQGRLPGIFIWSADDSMASDFTYEKDCQTLLAID